MIKFLAAYGLAVLLLGASLYAQSVNAPFTIVVGPPTGGCTPPGSPCPVGVAAPAGTHWNLVYSDDFTQDSTLNATLWDCPDANNCGPGLLYFDANGMNLQATAAVSGAPQGCIHCDAGLGSQFSPRFGFWEWSIKYPRGFDGSGDGYHIDTYINNNISTDRAGYEEVAAGGETVIGTSASNIANFYCCVAAGGSTDTVQVDVNINSPTRFSAAFHIFGTWWFDDGVGNGTISQYMDGSALYTNGRQGPGWGSGGAVIIMEEVSCYDSSQVFDGGNTCSGSTATSGNPISYKYFRFWQLAAGS